MSRVSDSRCERERRATEQIAATPCETITLFLEIINSLHIITVMAHTSHTYTHTRSHTHVDARLRPIKRCWYRSRRRLAIVVWVDWTQEQRLEHASAAARSMAACSSSSAPLAQLSREAPSSIPAAAAEAKDKALNKWSLIFLVSRCRCVSCPEQSRLEAGRAPSP